MTKRTKDSSFRKSWPARATRYEAAEDGEAAWEMLEEQDFDVVLCDINMPRLDGIGLLRRTRETEPEPA